MASVTTRECFLVVRVNQIVSGSSRDSQGIARMKPLLVINNQTNYSLPLLFIQAEANVVMLN